MPYGTRVRRVLVVALTLVLVAVGGVALVRVVAHHQDDLTASRSPSPTSSVEDLVPDAGSGGLVQPGSALVVPPAGTVDFYGGSIGTRSGRVTAAVRLDDLDPAELTTQPPEGSLPFVFLQVADDDARVVVDLSALVAGLGEVEVVRPDGSVSRVTGQQATMVVAPGRGVTALAVVANSLPQAADATVADACAAPAGGVDQATADVSRNLMMAVASSAGRTAANLYAAYFQSGEPTVWGPIIGQDALADFAGHEASQRLLATLGGQAVDEAIRSLDEGVYGPPPIDMRIPIDDLLTPEHVADLARRELVFTSPVTNTATLLAGGIDRPAADGVQAFGPDSRKVEGTTRLLVTVNGDGTQEITTSTRLQVNVVASLDFCPGDAITEASSPLRPLLATIADGEAAGTYNDIGFTVEYELQSEANRITRSPDDPQLPQAQRWAGTYDLLVAEDQPYDTGVVSVQVSTVECDGSGCRYRVVADDAVLDEIRVAHGQDGINVAAETAPYDPQLACFRLPDLDEAAFVYEPMGPSSVTLAFTDQGGPRVHATVETTVVATGTESGCPDTSVVTVESLGARG